MSPFGGRGLNSGIQDAWNVVWKLALVRAGIAPDALLETYNDERQPAALENLRLTADTMRFLVPKPGPARWRRDAILRLSLPFSRMRKRVNAGHLSNPYTYTSSPLISEDIELAGHDASPTLLTRFRRGPVAGSLAPELVLTDAAGASISLLDLFGESFVVFCLTADPDTTLTMLDEVRSTLPANIPVSLYIIASRPPNAAIPDGIACLLDADGRCAAAYGAGPSTIYLMRPDRHIAARSFQANFQELPALLRRAAGLGLAFAPAGARVGA